MYTNGVLAWLFATVHVCGNPTAFVAPRGDLIGDVTVGVDTPPGIAQVKGPIASIVDRRAG